MDAEQTMLAWEAKCVAKTGAMNAYIDGGQEYLFMQDRRHYKDGRYTGSIWHAPKDQNVTFAGKFHIAGDGRVMCGPQILKDCA